MSELQVSARLKIHPGKLEEFEAAARTCVEIVRERDSGTLEYDWYLSEDGSECEVRERYRDSEAVLEHLTNLGDQFGALLAIADLSVEIYGEPSAELLEATAAIPTKVYGLLTSL